MSSETETNNAMQDVTHEKLLGRVEEAIYAVDDDWRFAFVNDEAARLLDRDATALLGESVWETFPDSEDSVAYTKFHEAMESQEPERFDTYYEPLDAWFTVRAYPDEDGLTVCFYDVTEERGRQLELQRKQRLFEAVFEDTDDALVIADTDRRITDFNPAAEQLFGYDAADVEGESSRLLYADDDAYEQQGTERFNESAPENHDSYVVTYERADGTTFEGETVGTPLESPDGETLAYLGSIRDVSQRLAYERDIEQRNEAFREFHDVTTDESRSPAAQMRAVLELGCSYLDLDAGLLSSIDGTEYTVERAAGHDDTIGDQFALDETCCDRVADRQEPVSFSATDDESGEARSHVGAETVDAYLGAPVYVDGEFYGTLNFSSRTPRGEAFTESERTFARLLAQWAGKELSRRQNRARARANRDRLRQIIDMLPQLVFAKGEDGEFLLANEAMADAYGTTVDELEGATDADFADSQEEAEQFRADDRAVIGSGEPKHIPEEPLTTADGEQRIFETTKIPYDPVDTSGDAVLGVATDITELKEKQQELEVQSAAMEASMDGIAILDADNEYIYMNGAHADVFDYDPDELTGSSWRRVYSEDEIERVEAAVFPELAEHGEWRGETVGKRKDGSSVHQEITLSLLDDGKLICTNRDITVQKERERELERQRTRLRALFDESPDGIIIHDNGGNVIDVNRTKTEALGYDREEILAMNVAEFEAGFDQSELEAVWADMDEGDMLKVEGNHRRRDGSTFPVEVWVNKIEVHGRERFIAVDRDITERKQNERELRELTERLDLAVEGANLGVWDWNMETDAVTFNDQWARMLGLSPEDVDPHLDTWEERVHPADMERVEEALEAHMAGDAERYDCEHRMLTASGDWKWIRDVGEVVERDGDGNPMRAVGIHIDIADQKETETHLEEERDMFASGPAVVFKWQNQAGWPVEYVSGNVTETFGYTPDQLESGEVPYETLVHDDDLERVSEEVEKHTDETTERFSHDPYRMVTSDGEVRWVKDNTKIIRNDGEVTHFLGYLVDITERKQRERDLQRIRERFERFSSAVPDGFFLISPDYSETYYLNDATEDIYGLPTDEAKNDPEEWTRHIHPDDVDDLQDRIQQQRAGDTEWPVEQEFRIQHPDRGLRWLRVSMHPVRNEAGDIVELAGVTTDITERRRLEESLRENEQSLRELTAIASDTELDFDAKLEALLELGRERLDLPYAFLNRIEDDTQHVVQAKGDHTLLQPGESAPLSKSYCRKTIEQEGLLGVKDAVEEGWTGDDAYQTFELGCYLGGTVTVDGDRYGTLCFAGDQGQDMAFDPADRAFVELLVQGVSYELASEANERKLRGLNETAQRLMAAESEDDVARIAVESAEDVLEMPITGIWRYDEDNDVLRPEAMTDSGQAELQEQPTFSPGQSLAWEAFETGEVLVYDDLAAAADVHNDETALASEAILPLGEFGVICTGSTDERAFSEADISLLDVLSATVEAALDRAERERVLRETRAQLEQSNEQLEQFAYAASHDLQEPLRTVSSYLTLLERRYGDQLNEDAGEFIDIAVEGADRMQAMIQGLLDFSRVDTQGESFSDVDLGSVFDQVRQNIEVTIAETGATVDCPDATGTVEGDERQLVQLFQNLVENGIKYSDDQPHVEISVTRHDDVLECRVADDGIGIAPDQREQIFEVFQRLHTPEEFDGTGIGLSICRKIVDRHGGDITVESTVGEGSTFVVTLPIEEGYDE